MIQGKNWPFAVIGIGMNLNQETFPAEIPNAISLKQITGDHYEPASFARQLAHLIKTGITQLKKDPDQILSDFNQSLYRRNEIIALKKNLELFVTRLEKVDCTSQLCNDWSEVELKSENDVGLICSRFRLHIFKAIRHSNSDNICV